MSSLGVGPGTSVGHTASASGVGEFRWRTRRDEGTGRAMRDALGERRERGAPDTGFERSDGACPKALMPVLGRIPDRGIHWSCTVTEG